MKSDAVLHELAQTIQQRKAQNEEGSYTCYLFAQGLDKILKKVGEECAETIIAAKNVQHGIQGTSDLVGEVADLIYHLAVMLEDTGVPIENVLSELERRSQTTGNKKERKIVDKNT